MSIKISRRALRPRGIIISVQSIVPDILFNSTFSNARQSYVRRFRQINRILATSTTVYSVEIPRGTQRIDFRHNPNKVACVCRRQSVILLLADSSDFSAC